MRAVMIRDGDYYVGLRQRIEKAREHRADMFVSVHADAFRDRRVRGSSVFVISRSGATSEAARWLADRENAADLVGGGVYMWRAIGARSATGVIGNPEAASAAKGARLFEAIAATLADKMGRAELWTLPWDAERLV